MAIFAPISPSASAICRPSPREPPVIRAFLPFRPNNCWTLIAAILSDGLGLHARGGRNERRLLEPAQRPEMVVRQAGLGRHRDHRGDPARLALVLRAGSRPAAPGRLLRRHLVPV